jgi:hypothetical protein
VKKILKQAFIIIEEDNGGEDHDVNKYFVVQTSDIERAKDDNKSAEDDLPTIPLASIISEDDFIRRNSGNIANHLQNNLQDDSEQDNKQDDVKLNNVDLEKKWIETQRKKISENDDTEFQDLDIDGYENLNNEIDILQDIKNTIIDRLVSCVNILDNIEDNVFVERNYNLYFEQKKVVTELIKQLKAKKQQIYNMLEEYKLKYNTTSNLLIQWFNGVEKLPRSIFIQWYLDTLKEKKKGNEQKLKDIFELKNNYFNALEQVKIWAEKLKNSTQLKSTEIYSKKLNNAKEAFNTIFKKNSNTFNKLHSLRLANTMIQ